jgi:dienelactone hydrolase
MIAASKKGLSLGHHREAHNPLSWGKRNQWTIVWIGTVFLLSQIVDSFVIQQPRFLATRQLHRKTIISVPSSFGDLDDGIEDGFLNPADVEALTVPQLKQQLRLRGMKVTGKKQDLVDRLVNFSSVKVTEGSSDEETWNEVPLEPDVLSESESNEAGPSKSKTRQKTEERGKQYIDVTAYLDDEDQGKTTKSSMPADVDQAEDENAPSSNTETWGSEAKIIDDYEGRTPVVDGMSRTIIEFKGSNQTLVQAYVVASRDALKPFLAGGKNRTGDPEERLRELQTKREQAAKRPVRFEEDEGIDEGDETGLYENVLHRDESDWGKYTLTGAQISALEVQGVLLLSDVYGAFAEDTKALAEKIAFECQPVVVMIPDLFRGNPWKEDSTTPGFNEQGQDYEEWRAMHSDLRVSIDIRAAAAVLREQYGVSSIVVWGTCYGGGRALEIAAGHLPGGKIHDVDGTTIGPLPVEPEVAVAWYPTRYNAQELFGADKKKTSTIDGKERNMAVMGVFAGNDQLPGATPNDAAKLKSLLEEDDRVKDYMVKVFPNQDHGFAHNGLGTGRADTELDRFVDEEFGGAGRISMDGGDAEVACLLSTAFMETYSRVFLPTFGPPISKDELASEWSNDLNMKDLSTNTRDIRQEIEDSLENFKEEPLGGKMMDPTDESQRDELANMLRTMEPEDVSPELKIQPDDDLEMIYAKLKASDESFQIF